MRVLAVTTAGEGHLGPLVPFAGACRDADHDVLVAAPAPFASSVTRAGFAHAPFAPGPELEIAEVFRKLHAVSDDEANRLVITEVYGRLDARAALPDLIALVEGWKPDVILRESAEYASWVAALGSGTPHIEAVIGLSAFWRRALGWVAEPLAELCAAAGIDDDADRPRAWRSPSVSLLPASFDEPGPEGTPSISRFRSHEDRLEASPPLPDWWAGGTDPLVYVTFGSVAASMGYFPGLYREVVEVVADLPIRALLTVGSAGDPASLEPLPRNVHVEAWWPQAEVMPHAAAMIGHGGFGTVLHGLASGVPMVLLPLFADQRFNAGRVATMGAGLALEGGPAGMGWAVGGAHVCAGGLVVPHPRNAARRRDLGASADERGGIPNRGGRCPPSRHHRLTRLSTVSTISTDLML